MDIATKLLEAGRRYEAASKAAAKLPRTERWPAEQAASEQLKADIADLRFPADDMLALISALAAVCDHEAGTCSTVYQEGWEERAAWERAGAAFDAAAEHVDDATREPTMWRDYSSHTGHPAQVVA
jgi:hypothetical protein